jgi:hypothetical protein
MNNLCVISNVKGQNGSGKCELPVSLKPGDTRVMRFILIDPILPWGYKFSYSYKCLEVIKSEEHLKSLVRTKGALKVVNY